MIKQKQKKKSERIQNVCVYDGHLPIGVCISNQCQYRGFICFLCGHMRHSNHLNNIFTFGEIQDNIKSVIRLIQEIAFQFSLGEREDYSEHLENFTQNFWLLELDLKEYKSKQLHKEIVLLQSIPILREIKTQVTNRIQNHEYYFDYIKPLLFIHSKISRNHIEQSSLLINLMIKFLLFCALMVVILKFVLINEAKDV